MIYHRCGDLRQFQNDRGALAGGAADGEPPAHERGPLAHTRQAEYHRLVFSRIRAKAGAVIRDAQPDYFIGHQERKVYTRCLGVFGAVLQALLRDAVDHFLLLPGKTLAGALQGPASPVPWPPSSAWLRRRAASAPAAARGRAWRSRTGAPPRRSPGRTNRRRSGAATGRA